LDPVKLNKSGGPHPIRDAEIHPTAIVESGAQIGHNVKIGPYSIIGNEVNIGPDCVIGSSVRIDGKTTIGRGNRFFHGAAIGGEPQDKKFRGEATFVEIGDNNDFREFVTLNAATGEGEQTRIGDDNLLMAYVHIAHNCHISDGTVLANAVNLAGHVTVGKYAIIGGMSPVHQFVRIGEYSFVGGASRVSQDIPPFIRVSGNPLEVAGINSIGLKRKGFTDEDVLNLRKAYRLLYRSRLNVSQALDRIASECILNKQIEDLMAFIRRSDRGIVRGPSRQV
jgi:UDP-N-acetylglucosamine acyltransferase